MRGEVVPRLEAGRGSGDPSSPGLRGEARAVPPRLPVRLIVSVWPADLQLCRRAVGSCVMI